MTSVADLGCGLGLDALALAEVGLSVLAVERDPATAELARANAAALGLAARLHVVTGAAEEADLSAVDAVFADPARRAHGRRLHDPQQWYPPLAWVLARSVDALGVKVAPGLPVADVPDDVERELPARPPAVRPVQQVVLEPDGAIIRAGLVTAVADQIGAGLLDASLAYLTADEPVSTRFARAFAVVEVLPFQLKRLRAALRAHDVGAVEIKTRGSAVDPEDLRRRLRLTGSASMTVLVTRIDGHPTAILAHPA